MVDYNEVLKDDELFNTLIADPEQATEIRDWIHDKNLEIQQQIIFRKPLKGEKMSLDDQEEYLDWRGRMMGFQRRLLKRQRAVTEAIKQHNRDKSDEESRTYHARQLANKALGHADLRDQFATRFSKFYARDDAEYAADMAMEVLESL